MERYIRTAYTAQEIEKLKELIRQRVSADGKSAQKRIRDKMRGMGFYGSEFGIHDCQVSDLERLIRNGEIKVVGAARPSKAESNGAVTSPTNKTKERPGAASEDLQDASAAETTLINGQFFAVNTLSREMIPDVPGLYCIKLRKGIAPLPSKYGKVRDDGIIYIGKASASLRKRLWDQELNHKSAATFFRSIGAMLGYLPPKGSLYGKATRNYKFSEQDTEAIRKWMRQSLFINRIPLAPKLQKRVEESLIIKYQPLVNIEHNPTASTALQADRQRCVDHAKSK